MTIYGIALKPRGEMLKKIQIIKEYMLEQQIFSKEKKEIITFDDFWDNKFDFDHLTPEDTVVFSGLKDIYYLGTSRTFNDILNSKATILANF